MATVASGIGGTFTALCLAFFAPILANFALRFSAPEYFALAVFGLSVVVTLAGIECIHDHQRVAGRCSVRCLGLDPKELRTLVAAILPCRDDVAHNARESWRIFGIMSEFVEATERLAQIRPAVSMFGSARAAADSPGLTLVKFAHVN